MFTYVYLCLPLFTTAYSCLPVCHSCLAMFTRVYPCLLVLAYDYSCILIFTVLHLYLCLPIFTLGYLCLCLFIYVYICILVFTYVISSIHMFTIIYSYIFTYVYTFYLWEVCTDVKTEPDLQPLTGESMHHRTAVTTDEARLDVRAQGFWGSRFTRDYFDVKVFNPLARSYKNKPLRSTYGDLERLKRSYEQRVREIEHGTFTPYFSSFYAGWGNY